MQFKRFEAADMRQALAQVKRELGPDAVIVSSRQLRGGVFGGSRLEITAGLAPPPTAPPRPQDPAPAVGDQRLEAKLDPLRRELRALRGALQNEVKNDAAATLQQELASLRMALADLASRVHEPRSARPLATLLQGADLAPELVRRWHEAAEAEVLPRPGEPAAALMGRQLSALHGPIAAALQVDDGFLTAPGPRRVALVGPTGIGKTTTIAKIAAHMALRQNCAVALISLDTYRVGATEQLQQYARLMGLSLAVAEDAQGFAAALEAAADAELVLVDTAGRGPEGAEVHNTLLWELFAAHAVQPYLTLSATTRQAEMQGLLRTFMPLQPRGLIFTKLDEAAGLAALCNACQATQLPLTFITHGQRVPEDIAVPEAQVLAQRLVRELTAAHPMVQRLRPNRARATPKDGGQHVA